MANWIERFLAAIATHKSNASAHHTKFTITEHDVTARHPLGTVVPHDALASLTEKAHSSLTGIGASDHHAKYTDAEAQAIADALIATHTAIAAAHHARYTDGEAQAIACAQIAIHAALATVHQDAPALILTHKGDVAAHHTKYTDAEAKAAAVRAGAITNGETKAPTHDAVYDVKVTADAAQTAAEVAALILTHKNIAAAHHAKYTDAEAQATVKANVEVGDLKAPTKALPMNSQKVSGIGAPTAQDDALRKGRAEITDSEVIAANKDGVAATPSMRTLGAGAQQAAAGNHTHTLVEDVKGAGEQDGGTNYDYPIYTVKTNVVSGGDLDIASVTPTFAPCKAIIGFGTESLRTPDGVNSFKARLFVGGVQQAESGYLVQINVAHNPEQPLVCMAVNGATAIKCQLHNYYGSARDVVHCGLSIIYGSIKAV